MSNVPLRVTVIVHSFPYPAVHGGVIDTWNRIRALAQKGVGLQVLHWTDGADPLRPEAREIAREMGIQVVSLPRRRGAWRALLPHLPPWMTAHTIAASDFGRVVNEVKAFDPAWILCDSWIPYLSAKSLAMAVGLPLVYRSHNVENAYWRRIARETPGLAGLKLRFNAWRLASMEERIRLAADVVADIADDDLAHWAKHGAVGNALVLPPLWMSIPEPVPVGDKDIDVLLIGNLHMPNNVDGVRWFLRHVVPEIRRRRPEALRCTIAGSNPSEALQAECRDAGVTCIANPAEMRPLIIRSHVLANPVRFGSGVNLKMIEMLANGVRAVSTTAGARGLPQQARAEFTIADSPEDFAAAIVLALATPDDAQAVTRRTAIASAVFGPDRIADLFAAVDSLATKPTRR